MKSLVWRLLITGLTSLLWTGALYAQGNLGQSGANFIQIAVDPRGAALGGAYTAQASGATALYWNPAGIVHTQNIDIYLANTDWFLDTQLMYGGVVKSLGRAGSIGLAFTSFYMDEMEITSVYESEGTGNTYDAGDLAVGLSYARALTDRFTFGVTGKWIHEYIWNEETSALALDVGSMYRTDILNLRLGMAVKNFSGKLKFSGEDIDSRLEEERQRNQDNNPRLERLTPEFRLPQVFNLGIAFDPLDTPTSRLTLVADVDVPSDNEERITVGAETQWFQLLSLRGAYRFNDDLAGVSLGIGLMLQLGERAGRFDYAYADHGVLGAIHRFGLGLSL